MKSQNNPDTPLSIPAEYAHITSVVTTTNDTTLIFYRATPVKTDKLNSFAYEQTNQEVARVVLPNNAALELKDVLEKIFHQKEEKSKK